MKILTVITSIVFLSIMPIISMAGDVRVKGYTRSDGTYVRGHVRSSPDGTKANNYGASNGVNMMYGKNRDSDSDGTPNYLDSDDDNDGIKDDSDTSQYGSGW